MLTPMMMLLLGVAVAELLHVGAVGPPPRVAEELHGAQARPLQKAVGVVGTVVGVAGAAQQVMHSRRPCQPQAERVPAADGVEVQVAPVDGAVVVASRC